MGDFFYYGQKDAIRRLNELAGRGAVVSSYAPAVGRSPLGGPNGYMNPAWLDPNLPIRMNASIQTSRRLCSGPTAKYAYLFSSAVGQRNWYKLATFAPDDAGTQENLLIRGTINDSWISSQTSAVTLLMGVRNGLYVDWHLEGMARGNARIIVMKHPDLSYGVYAFLDGFANASFDLIGVNTETYADPVSIGFGPPAGTLVFDTSSVVGAPSYIAPRWQGYGVGGASTLFKELVGVGDGTITTSFLSPGGAAMAPGQERDSLRLGVGGVSGSTAAGCFSWFTSAGNNNGTPNNLYKTSYKMTLRAYDTQSNQFTNNLIEIKGTGTVVVPEFLEVGRVNTQPQGTRKFSVPNCLDAVVVSGNFGNIAGSALNVATHTVTGSSIRTGGTVNTSGNDYAEYISKSLICGIVKPGQIVGITANNKITDLWADAVMFSIKSTAPSFVGGDSWADDVGPRPSPQAGAAPVQPVRREDVVAQQAVPDTDPQEFEEVVAEPGDTDDEWAEKLAAFEAVLAAHAAAVQQDADAMATFDAALEAERQKVDRIAISGRVPVNVLGAQAGDYIVPVQDGAGIKGISVRKADLTQSQYLDAVGRVISIEPDGRAYVMVKVV
ncbi:hypothetical protein [Janthinobacterium violaceinigrum]|uniref:Uncharacterized protein n=1 Tax=Janthinobacterium violaceinigrum TaxID=2654252 RepID=A0A6I1IFY0_9BURK|nr:hypothetical protein [Janthinobacterium violaceinigrum]KAB8066278.1 hypothetical protein GCN75_03535 [Janthinobacterium violaceinigrum]